MGTLRMLRRGFPEPPAMDTALSHATLRLVAEGEVPETLRVHRPGPVVAFGPRDRVASGFPEAVRAAADRGFAAVERLAGGRAAVFHEGTIALSWATPLDRPREGIRERFELVSEVLGEAIRSLGIDARVGEVPGEYCPGEHSINARGETKLAGVGQRIIGGAAHVGGVIVVSGADRVREVLVPVYEALGLDWDPATTGSIEDESLAVTWEAAATAVERAFSERYDLREDRPARPELSLARELLQRHAIE